MKVFFHNKHDAKSNEMLQKLPPDVEAVDYFAEPHRAEELGVVVNELPCLVEIGEKTAVLHAGRAEKMQKKAGLEEELAKVKKRLAELEKLKGVK